MADVAEIARGLTKAQVRLVMESEPGGFGRNDCATGTPIRGGQYRTAAALQRLGIGTYSQGSPYEDLYFNTDDLGLAVRAHLKENGGG